MKLRSILIPSMALGLASLNAQPVVRCATPEPTPAQLEASRILLNAYRQSNSLASSRTTFNRIEVPVNFHIVMDNSGNGDVTTVELNGQITALNNSYQTQNVHFYINSVTRTENTDWANHEYGSAEETAMKNGLGVAPDRTLNFYICYNPQDNFGNTLLGYATFPASMGGPASNDNEQGVVVLYDTLPGGTNGGEFDEGDTGTHEVGHYLGLWHVFQDGCSTDNDQCDDTPACQASYGKPVATTDTCTTFSGLDPINNFMNYVDDDWMDHYTADQRTRSCDVTALDRTALTNEVYLWADAPWTGTGGMHTVSWMSVDLDTTQYPWVLHPHHGWLLSSGDSTSDNLWIYTADLGWTYTTQNTYPWIYRSATADWLFYLVGSDNPRWFYSSKDGIWIEVNTNSHRPAP